MALSDLATRTGTPWQACAACWTLETLPPKRAELLLAALGNKLARYSEIAADLLTEDGIDVDRQALSRHARGQCSARVKLR